MTEVTLQAPHSYEPKAKRFVLHTLSQAVAHAQSWDEVESGCEAIANALRIAKDLEAEALRANSSAASLDQLKALGREIAEYKVFDARGCPTIDGEK
ncbi:MAG TPA: hypothetical protein VFS27_06235 [Blastocatellia bacterium]|jgi:hypothetical protein|nr:hypothetical protein [Blastocatellia bacterium]